MPPSLRWQRRAKVAGYRSAARLLPLVPRPLGLALAGGLGHALGRLVPGARRSVEANLAHVLGPTAPTRVRSAARAVLANTLRNYFDFFRIPHLPLAEFDRLVKVVGEEHFWPAYRAGRGVVLVTAHLGAVDAAVQVFRVRQVDVLVLVEPLDPPELLDLSTRIRRGHGVQIEPVGPAGLRRAIGRLKAGGVVIVVSDEPIAGRGAAIRFFDATATLPTGAIELALRTGAALVPAFSVRCPDQSFVVTVEPEIPLDRTGERDRAVAAALPLVRDSLERAIAAHPDQWVVYRPIWPAPAVGRMGHPAAPVEVTGGHG